VSCFSAETRWSPMLGVSEIPNETPNTREKMQPRLISLMMQEETKNLLKTAQASKVVSPFTRALAPPFYRETKGLLYSKNTLKSKEYS
jgi:hypothetical protein